MTSYSDWSHYHLSVDVYRVGLLQALFNSHSHLKQRKFKLAYRELNRCFRHLKSWVKEGNWRAVKNTFNGYLAEPKQWPPGAYPNGRKCGHGWTKKRALRSLYNTVAGRNYPLHDI